MLSYVYARFDCFLAITWLYVTLRSVQGGNLNKYNDGSDDSNEATDILQYILTSTTEHRKPIMWPSPSRPCEADLVVKQSLAKISPYVW